MMRTEPEPDIGVNSASLNLLRGMTAAASDIDGLPGQRKIQIKRGSFSRAAFHADLAGMFLDNAVGHREPQSGSALLTCFRSGLRGEERIVNSRDMLRGNAAAGVGYAYRHSGAIRGRHAQSSTCRHGILRIQEQVKENLLQASSVSLDQRQMRGQIVFDRNPRSFELVLEQSQGVVDDLVHIHVAKLSAAGAREIQQVADNLGGPEGLPRNLLEQRGFLGIGTQLLR